MKQHKISIVTPSYNQGRFIEKAILSVLDQNYENFEHIIYDNCSTDNTVAIAEKYPHISFISEADRGQSHALNKGFLRASGDIIGWLNADDYYLPDTFAKVNSELSDPEIDAIYSNVKFVNELGEFQRNLKTHRPVRWMTFLYTYIQSTSLFFKKEIVEKHILDESLHLCMDMEFYARLQHEEYKFKFVDDYFACFRWHGDNKSQESEATISRNMKEIFYMMNKVRNVRINHTRTNEILYRTAVNTVAKPVRQFLIKSGF